MADECLNIMQSIRGTAASRTMAGSSDGRKWVSCVSCASTTVLGSSRWLAKERNQAMLEKDGFVFSLCGRCERRGGEKVGTGQSTRMIRRAIMSSSPAFLGIASRKKSEWDELVIKTERVIDRETLLGKELGGMTIRSVEIARVEDEWVVKVLDHVEVRFLG